MSKATAKSDLLSLLQDSEGKSKSAGQSDYADGLIDIIAALIEASGTKTTVATVVTGTLPSGPVAAAGAQTDAPGTITVPS